MTTNKKQLIKLLSGMTTADYDSKEEFGMAFDFLKTLTQDEQPKKRKRRTKAELVKEPELALK